MRGWRLAAAAALLLAPPAGAAEPAPVEQTALLELFVNRVDHGVVVVQLRGDDAWVELAALTGAGLRGVDGRRERLGGKELVSLASLAPGVTFVVDTPALALRLTVAPRLLGTTVVDLGAGPPPGLRVSQSPSGFLNYALSWTDPGGATLFGEAGASLRSHLLTSTFTLADDGTFLRGLTRLLADDRSHLRRLTVGDQLATTGGPLAGGALLAGIGVSREFGLDPYFVRFPTPDLSGALLAPSSVEVYVDDLLVARESLPPGEFDLRHLPVPAGSVDTRLVIRDPFGGERQLSSSFYFSTGVLARGLDDYGFHLGWRRTDLAGASPRYDTLTFVGRDRRGLTDRLTAGFNLEADRSVQSGGPDFALRLPLGEIAGALSVSRDDGRPGRAAALQYSFSGRRVGFGASLRAMSERYTDLATAASLDERPRWLASLSVGLPVGRRANLTLQASRETLRAAPARESLRLGGDVRLGGRASLTLVASRLRDPVSGDDDRLFVGLSSFLGSHTTARVAVAPASGGGRAEAEVQKSLPEGPGYGYRLRVGRTAGRTDGEATVFYQTPFGRAEASHQELGGVASDSFRFAGGLVALGGHLFASRPIEGGYALVRVPGVAGVRIYRSNQEVGRTDGRGDLLVPDLLPYFANRLSIGDQDVPLDRSLETRERAVATPFRAGTVVTFPAARLASVMGTLVVVAGGRPRLPGPGTLEVAVDGASRRSPLGRRGEFYLEELPAGTHAAHARFEGGSCRFTLEVPDRGEPLTDLGRVSCTLDGPPGDADR